MMFMHIITYSRCICLRIYRITLFHLVISQCFPFQDFMQYLFIFYLPSDMKPAYEDLREQLSKLSRALKILETKALKQTFSTNEIASKVS